MMTLKEISEFLSIPYEGDGTIMLSGPSEPKDALEDQLAVALNEKFFEDLTVSEAKVAVVLSGTNWMDLGLSGALFVQKPRYALARINSLFEEAFSQSPGVHASAVIAGDAKIGKNVSIGPFTVISSKVEIKDNSIIASHVYIDKDVIIGKNALIYSGVRIGSKVVVGDRFICHSNAVIGSDGFSFVSPEGGGIEQARKTGNSHEIFKTGSFMRIASLGSVDIGTDVEIGAGSTIDSGTIVNTVIGSGTKLDNLVHIGHNAVIGENCLLCGQVGIAGSAKIGDRVVLAGQVGVADHVSIGSDSIIAAKSGVSSNVAKGRFMMGNPAMKMESNIESYKLFRRLPRIIKRLEGLHQRFHGKS